MKTFSPSEGDATFDPYWQFDPEQHLQPRVHNEETGIPLSDMEYYECLLEFQALGRRYDKLNDSIVATLEKYIRTHPGEFCVDEDGREMDLHFTGEYKTVYPDGAVREVFSL